jgi:hypothetical protein
MKRDDETKRIFEDKFEWIVLGIILLVFLLVLFPAMLFFERHSSSGVFSKYEVRNVIDGKTLRVHLLELEEGAHEGADEMPLMGIWSDQNQEPENNYQNRLKFLQSKLVGQTIKGQWRIYVDPNPPEPPDFGPNASVRPQPYREKLPKQYFQTPQKPSEVLLNDGVSLNQLLLENGYAAFDFTDNLLDKEDRERYEAAEAKARVAQLGVWSSPESVQKYVTARELFERNEGLKKSGLGFYLLTQAGLILIIAILMCISKKYYGRESFVAALKLLSIPGVLLLVVFARRIWTTAAYQSGDPNTRFGYLFYLFLILAAVVWGASQFGAIVARGPLQEWKTLWKSSQAKRAIWLFFIGLGSLIIVFALTYRLAGGANSIGASLWISFSQALTLGYPLPKTGAVEIVAVVQNRLLWLWTVLCGYFVPNVRVESWINLSLKKAVFVSLTSFAVLALMMASVFANIFYYNIHVNGFSRPLDLAECFVLALLTFLRTSFRDVYPTSGWMAMVQSLESCIALLLQLVLFRFIFSSVRKAVEQGQGSKESPPVNNPVR